MINVFNYSLCIILETIIEKHKHPIIRFQNPKKLNRRADYNLHINQK